ncbi:hypothetical protein BHE74_00016028 [Ensete ventricosum]|nr:hypothetical protein GW17_00043693 [Ensete ventricosum]RWW75910.1 hypothetical protein BHE74_00016028 [Ensete ventricosum]RZR94740.1 hypothetical protein BHM03_00023498 [Ensete ventricosum]
MAIINSLPTFLLVVPLLLSHVDGRSLSDVSGDAAAFLVPHNELRRRTGVPPLQWSTQLADVALQYANQRKRDCALVHSTLTYGENIFWGQGKSWTIGNADCSHYTQMVWKTTQRVGCARIFCDSGDTYAVCEYDPHGNVIGARPY